MMNVRSVLAAACVCALVACSSSKTPSETTMRGSLALTSFPSAPTAVEAKDEQGAVVRAAVDPSGSFALALPAGHTYTASVILAAGSEPMVYPRKSGRLDPAFKVSSKGAVVALGSVRHVPAAPAGGFKIKSAGADGEVDDDNVVECESGDHHDDGADGECENGKDAKTGAPCTDDDAAEGSADPAKPMAVAEHNAPDDVGGCEDGEADGETADD